ncbi:MAG: radical SAM protein, partial [Rikenellaceae bacterium]|nr:radical SAM protein [Rikenellaceae bacterium]
MPSDIRFPLLKIIDVCGRSYAYDARAHFLSEVSPSELDFLLRESPEADCHSIPASITTLWKRNVFRPGGFKRITPYPRQTTTLVKEELENQIPRKCQIEITEECTLRCKYCLYTREDPGKRQHSVHKMDTPTAFKAVDLYYDRYIRILKKIPGHQRNRLLESYAPSFTFWGDEPLTNFELLKEIVRYVRSLGWKTHGIHKINYALVTNFTVLNDQIIDFLLENNFYLQVSLDGDRQEHDRNQVYPDGQGSFDDVLGNLQRLVERFPEYAKNNLTINTVLACNTAHKNIAEFIRSRFYANPADRKILSWEPGYERKPGEFLARAQRNTDTQAVLEDFHSLLRILEEKQPERIPAYLGNHKSLFRDLLEIFLTERLLEVDTPTGTDYLCKSFSCPFGSDTLFVAANGTLHGCCKADQSMPIGDVASGLEAPKIESLYNRYFEKIERQCASCWAVHFCKICPALVGWDNDFLLPRSEECDALRKNAEILIAKFILLNSEFPNLHGCLEELFQSSADYR